MQISEPKITTRFDPVTFLTEGYVNGEFRGLFSDEKVAMLHLREGGPNLDLVKGDKR